MNKETETLVEENKKSKRWFITDWDDEINYIENIKPSINQLIQTNIE
jgi:hypothetical protein